MRPEIEHLVQLGSLPSEHDVSAEHVREVFLLANREKIARVVRKLRLPAMFPFRQYHEAGVLMSYGPDYAAAMRQVATYVDRILKGANPAELSIEQVSKYELVLNLRVAQELRLHVPDSILARADEVIK